MFGSKTIRTITRTELYERVWMTPMTILAKEYAISDVGLREACKRANIPLPPGGYWMKKQHGKRLPRKPPLPPLQSDENEVIRIAETPKKIEIEIDVPPEIAQAIESERAHEEPIPFPNSATPHAIVRSWERARQPGYGPSSFTPAAESRRRRIASVLLREIEKRGGKVTSDNQHAFDIVLFSQTIKITISERMLQERVPLAEKERGWYSRDYRTELRPSGLLRLRFENYFRQPLRKEWNETADKPLEGRLREIVIGLYVAAAALQREAEAEAIRRQREAEEQQRRWEAALQRKKKRERVEALLEDAASWSKAETLRKYIAAVERCGAKAENNEWLSFARRIADALDPLVESETVDWEEPQGNFGFR